MGFVLKTQRRISPLLYEVVHVKRQNTSKALVRSLLNGTERETPPCTYVRHLALESCRHCSPAEARLCTHLQDFGANAYFTDPALLPILAEIGTLWAAVIASSSVAPPWRAFVRAENKSLAVRGGDGG
ncbi:hypothetical protein B0H14DRAFT_3430948 [Mycena olivaceomarginata]|nr:hypothetical protein B0H14DRAFT_3430948 [Mycena olivaceomarginata]